MRKKSVLGMACSVAAGVMFAFDAGLPLLARAEAPRWEEKLPAMRIQADTGRNRVWVLNLDGVYVYDSRTGKLVNRVELPDWTVVNAAHVCAPDLALASSGGALVTSNIVPVVWEIEAEGKSVRLHKLAVDADNDKDFGFAALAFGRGGRDLLAVSSTLGSAWRIDLAADKAHKVRSPGPVRSVVEERLASASCGAGLSGM